VKWDLRDAHPQFDSNRFLNSEVFSGMRRESELNGDLTTMFDG
jgi:hypothetical protein